MIDDLDRWLASLLDADHLDADHLDATIGLLLTAADEDDAAAARVDAARRTLDDCKTRLGKYRAAIEDDVDARIVATWISEVEGDRLAAEIVLAEHDASTIDEDALREALSGLDMAAVLRDADPADKAAVYGDLGLTLTYDPAQRTVVAQARPVYVARVGGGT